MTTKIYIAGSISDGGTLPIEVQAERRKAFDEAEKTLSQVILPDEDGVYVINPMRRGVDKTKTWLDYMRESLVDISQADGIALLPGWENSRGALVEYDLGIALGLDVRPLSEWLAPEYTPPSVEELVAAEPTPDAEF